MRVMVFSDSHGNTGAMNELAEKYKKQIDCIVHLGDCTEDTAELSGICPGIPVFQVRGNNDYDSMYPHTRTATIGGKRILMTHGHRQKVYYNTDMLYYSVAEEQADIAMFGHTHIPYLENEGGILIINPGSISLPRSSLGRTFAFLIIESGTITASIMSYSRSGIQKLKSISSGIHF